MAESTSTTHTELKDEFQDSEKAQMELHLWRRLFSYIFKYRGHIAIIASCGAVTGITEVIPGYITMRMVKDIQAHGPDASLTLWAILIVLTGFVASAVVFGFVMCVCKVRSKASYQIRDDAFRNIQQQSFRFFDRRPVGWLMARLMSDCERLSNIVAWGFLDFSWGTAMMLSMAVVMLFLNWKLALFALAFIPLIAWVTVKLRRSILRTAREVRATNSVLTGTINESIMGVLTSKSFVQEESHLKDLKKTTDKLYNSSVENLTISAVYVPIVMTTASMVTGVTLAVGGLEVVQGVFVLSVFLAFMMWVRYFLEPAMEMAAWFTEMQTAQASAERVLAVMDALPDIVSKTNSTYPTPSEIESVHVRNLGFAYDSDVPVLQDINFKINAGESLAIVGPTGGGKTTLVNLLCRFYEPTTGIIEVNGIDYREFSLNWYRSQLGVVLQHAHVFSGPILENIRYGRIDATDEEVIATARLAGAHVFIEAMEHGYQTNAGAGGSKLSAGQKQLVSIARALLSDPQILVFDEATSSVDTDTEQHIQQGIEQLLRERICFIIAHRLSTIRNVDKIAFVEAGRIVEFGSHVELLRQKGLYATMYQQQSLREAVRSSFELAERARN